MWTTTPLLPYRYLPRIAPSATAGPLQHYPTTLTVIYCHLTTTPIPDLVAPTTYGPGYFPYITTYHTHLTRIVTLTPVVGTLRYYPRLVLTTERLVVDCSLVPRYGVVIVYGFYPPTDMATAWPAAAVVIA